MTQSILIVDDQIGIRMLLQEVFQTAGYRTSLAKNGKEAVEHLSESPCDLVVLDYHIPVYNGKAVMQKIKQMRVEAKTIIITGLPEVAKQELGENLPEEIISKPFNVAKLCHVVEEILKKNE
ncbi:MULTISPECIES: response regulator [Oceanobacillus]|uniref:Sporulation initiation phosphotransferase F n=2 Tax=Oceanobacillus TaxID=182709 RepID=A0A0A1MM40_9BACI|nr:response regulator [Oceanobacillus oncorhynchi]MDM8102759.1 response regulator [Oceanobacillus oncorhynchi]UUI39635.1 response regulator [Oceanobacillus oncorhynchi]CEI80747.1 Sporulation initiation phosphotransferase F [Oceanobacillus oncorhynchi]